MATTPCLVIVAVFLAGCVAPPGPRAQARFADPLDAVVQAARADAALRSGMQATRIAVVAAQSVIWSDASLGCPRAGILSTQALVPGYRVQLRAGSQEWDYHAGDRGGLVLCPAGQAQEPAGGGRD